MVWLGMNNLNPGLGAFYWTDINTPTDFSYWADGEPQTSGASLQDPCAVIDITMAYGNWTPVECSDKATGLCQQKIGE